MRLPTPSHRGSDGGKPRPECEFRRFVTSVFGWAAERRPLGGCELYGLRNLFLQRTPACTGTPVKAFLVCPAHYALAAEPEAQRMGTCRVVGDQRGSAVRP